MNGGPASSGSSLRSRCYGLLYRQLLYPTFDRYLKRRQTIRFWREAEASQWWSPEQLQAHQFEALKRLIRHAWDSCPYYRSRWQLAGLHPDQLAELEDFQHWPLLEREDIRENPLGVRSEGHFVRLQKSTGGSTGQPLRFELDKQSNDRRTAITHRGYAWAGGSPGSRQLYLWGEHLGSQTTWQRLKRSLHRRLDHQLFLSCFAGTPEAMRDHLKRIDRYRPEVIIAYTNPLYEFARFLERESLAPHAPKSIIVGAEKLHDFQRRCIERVFRCPVFETYGSREFMLIGAECDRHAGLHLSAENLLVEIVDDDGFPTPEGAEGNVVITDLFNYAMPFIRYLNGDRAIAGFGNCECGRGLPVLRRVVGRRLDVLQVPGGRLVPGEFFPHLIKDYPQVERFQVVQSTDGMINLKIVVSQCGDTSRQPAPAEAVAKQLDRAIRERLGESLPLRVESVAAIPLTATGKHRVVIRAA